MSGSRVKLVIPMGKSPVGSSFDRSTSYIDVAVAVAVALDDAIKQPATTIATTRILITLVIN